jgi:DNA-binding transcriptional MerR regulator/effector-binding domain-containing protein
MKYGNLFGIGEFSKITGLTVKTLRFYHEQGVLSPTAIDEQTGYRYYDSSKIELARVVTELRALDVSVADIAEILRSAADEADLLAFLEQHRESILVRLRHYQKIAKFLDQVIAKEREARATMSQAPFEVAEKVVDPLLVAGMRMKGKYSDCGKGFAQIGRRFGRHICGKALLLHYDTEYREEDADFEACLPIRKGETNQGISVRELAGGKCVSLLHSGPYHELGRSYAKILKYVKDKSYQIQMPTREVYLKGPGMVFKGNPQKYLTEIQMLVQE